MRDNFIYLLTVCFFIVAGYYIIKPKIGDDVMGIPKYYLSDPHWVRATIYYPFKRGKNVTASGYQFKAKISDTCRIIAVSRNLLKKYPFHTKILLVGAQEDDGIYKVEDLMAPRFKNRIDILVNGTHKLIMYDSVRLYTVRDEYFGLKH